MQKVFDGNGNEIDMTDNIMTKDPVVMLIYLLFVEIAPARVIASMIKRISDNKGKDFVLENKHLGEFAKQLVERIY